MEIALYSALLALFASLWMNQRNFRQNRKLSRENISLQRQRDRADHRLTWVRRVDAALRKLIANAVAPKAKLPGWDSQDYFPRLQEVLSELDGLCFTEDRPRNPDFFDELDGLRERISKFFGDHGDMPRSMQRIYDDVQESLVNLQSFVADRLNELEQLED